MPHGPRPKQPHQPVAEQGGIARPDVRQPDDRPPQEQCPREVLRRRRQGQQEHVQDRQGGVNVVADRVALAGIPQSDGDPGAVTRRLDRGKLNVAAYVAHQRLHRSGTGPRRAVVTPNGGEVAVPQMIVNYLERCDSSSSRMCFAAALIPVPNAATQPTHPSRQALRSTSCLSTAAGGEIRSFKALLRTPRP